MLRGKFGTKTKKKTHNTNNQSWLISWLISWLLHRLNTWKNIWIHALSLIDRFFIGFEAFDEKTAYLSVWSQVFNWNRPHGDDKIHSWTKNKRNA